MDMDLINKTNKNINATWMKKQSQYILMQDVMMNDALKIYYIC